MIIRKTYSKIRLLFLIIKFKYKIRKNKKIKLIIGASGTHQKNWIDSDQQYLDILKLSDWNRFFDPNSIDAILAEHVWEHLTIEEALIGSKNCFKYLKKGGYLRLGVPDGFHKDKQYIDWVKVNGSGLGADDHKVLYNYKTLSKLLENAGFKIRLLEYFDENKNFNFKTWHPNDGMIIRSSRFDERNKFRKLSYTSIVLDAIKE